MADAWGTPDVNEQILWGFAHQDYGFVIERVWEQLQANQAQYVQLQLLLISLQRCASDDNARAIAEQCQAQVGAEPWPTACLRLTLGDATTEEVLALATSDVERWRTWFYTWSRCLTTWRRQEARAARRECNAIGAVWEAAAEQRAQGGPTILDVPCPEILILGLEWSHLAPDAVANPALTGAGVAIMGSKKELRLFVSSTFRDLQAEREHLAKHVFPQIRTMCEERGVWFSDVDLRWGVSSEEAADGDVLPVCLAAIDQCRPNFIGILGNRYGWQPGELPSSLVDRFPWLRDCAGRSITEIEFRHGVLNDPSAATGARFYFRIDGQPSAETNAAELEGLRAGIRNRGLTIAEFKTPEELGALVLNDLQATIDARFSPDVLSTFLDDEHALHEQFALDRAEVYVGRWSYHVSLDQHAASTTAPLLVVGGGRGVSSVLGDWGRHYRNAHPNELVLLHFVGASAASVQWTQVAGRIAGEIMRRTGFEVPPLDGIDALPRLLQLALEHAAALGRVVLVLDGLHELDAAWGGTDLLWLPAAFPENVRVVLSSSSLEQLQTLQPRSAGYMEVEALTTPERTTLVREYLHRWSKKLDDDRVERIASAQTTASPWFLRVLLEELRLSGSHEALPALIDTYIGSPDLVALLQRVFARLEKDYEIRRPGLVGDALRLLWASRRGRAERQMLQFLGRDGEPLPQRDWLPLHMAMEAWLHGPQGDLRLPNWAFRTAVERQYVQSPDAQRLAYAALEAHLAALPIDESTVIERPWLLVRAERWSELASLLAMPGFFARAWRQDPNAVKEYWTRIETASPLKRVDAYGPFLRAPENYDLAELAMLSQFLTESGLPGIAESLQQSLTTSADEPPPAIEARLIAERARTAYAQQDLPRALALYEREEAIHRAAGNLVGVTSSRSNQALILKDQERFDEALAIQMEAEKAWRDLGDWAAVALSLGNQGVIHSRVEQPGQALTCHDEELRIYTRLGDQAGRQRAQSNRGNALHALGRNDEALAAWHEAAGICRTLGNPADLAAVLHNEAMFWSEAEDPSPALALLPESAALFERLGQLNTAAWDYFYLGTTHQKVGHANEALSAYRDCGRVFHALGDARGELAAVANQAQILHLTRRPAEALEQWREMERLARDTDDVSSLIRALANQGSLLVGPLEDPRAALAPLEEAFQLLQRPELASFGEVVRGLRASALAKLGAAS